MPRYVEDQFLRAAKEVGLKVDSRADGLWRIEHVLAHLRSDRLAAFGQLCKPETTYRKVTLAKTTWNRINMLTPSCSVPATRSIPLWTKNSTSVLLRSWAARHSSSKPRRLRCGTQGPRLWRLIMTAFLSTMDRRQFAKTAGYAAGAVAAQQLWSKLMAAQSAEPVSRSGEMIYRLLGRTGERVSAIGLGGYHLGKPALTDDEAVRLARQAIDRGITFMDNCWDYNDGVSELRMGKALAGGYRNKVFLMTKIDGRTKAAAAEQIDQSLMRLRTDRVDLMQFHEVIRLEDPDRIFAEGGAMEAMLAARQAGKVRFVGFTGHKDPYVHLRMLDEARQRNFHFDAVQMPLNVMDAHFRSFTHEVLPVLVKEGIAPLGMKCFGDHYILQSKTVQPIEALQYCLNLPIAVQITGIDSTQILEQAMEAARTFKPMTEAEEAGILAKTSAAARDGKFELYKTTAHFDGTAHNPSMLG